MFGLGARLVIGPLSSSSSTGQTEHTSGASQCESDAAGFSRVAAGASAPDWEPRGLGEGPRRSNCKCQK